VGSPVLAVADGTVVLARDLFYANAVFIDHGDSLVSMYFHLGEVAVTAGKDIKKGHTLGTVGSTGRATGPHLFFGVRWHGARINPDLLFEDRPRSQKYGPRILVKERFMVFTKYLAFVNARITLRAYFA
jgi:murein DD-endopeptidase MepM/ murein hydrolase activator NlpD